MAASIVLFFTLFPLFTTVEQNSETISVMTFNIRYGRANDGENSWQYRKNLVFDVIRESECDFIGMQEAMVFQIEEILDVCTDYQYIGISQDQPAKHQAIALPTAQIATLFEHIIPSEEKCAQPVAYLLR